MPDKVHEGLPEGERLQRSISDIGIGSRSQAIPHLGDIDCVYCLDKQPVDLGMSELSPRQHNRDGNDTGQQQEGEQGRTFAAHRHFLAPACLRRAIMSGRFFSCANVSGVSPYLSARFGLAPCARSWCRIGSSTPESTALCNAVIPLLSCWLILAPCSSSSRNV